MPSLLLSRSMNRCAKQSGSRNPGLRSRKRKRLEKKGSAMFAPPGSQAWRAGSPAISGSRRVREPMACSGCVVHRQATPARGSPALSHGRGRPSALYRGERPCPGPLRSAGLAWRPQAAFARDSFSTRDARPKKSVQSLAWVDTRAPLGDSVYS